MNTMSYINFKSLEKFFKKLLAKLVKLVFNFDNHLYIFGAISHL